MKTWTKIYVTLGLVAVIVVAGPKRRLVSAVKDALFEVVSDSKIHLTPDAAQ